METINERTVERLCVYRRLIRRLQAKKTEFFYSHDLALMANVTSVQVRRDLMYIGYSGNNRKGYEIKGVLKSMDSILDSKEGMKICIVGVGNLGKALVNFFSDKSEKLTITALFDIDQKIVGKTFNGIPCYHVSVLNEIISRQGITIGIISTSGKSAKVIADEMVSSGIISIVNFTTTPLNLPEKVFLEQTDITTSIEKASYFAKIIRDSSRRKNNAQPSVMIVDDDIDIVNSYKAMMEASGFSVSYAQNGEDGMKMVKKEQPDLIVLDIMMEKPDSGFIFLNELREKGLSIPVILCSSIARATANILDVNQLNIKTILQKPVDLDELITKIRKYLEA
ncbi:MAG: redox-sensing transcriptional repressor Rex [Candidatus Delongbacteria bacterium]|nr:redox-sensing transcriptional repressor Rex [Candidatus Delongbacteria bacterium]